MKVFDFSQFCIDYRIPTATEGHRHYRQGWIDIECPFCQGNSHGYHLGFNVMGDYFNCWRCRGKSQMKVVQKLLKCTSGKAMEVIELYRTRSAQQFHSPVSVRDVQTTLPSGAREVEPRHMKYLLNRGFEESIVEEYGLKGTGVSGDFKHRLVIPITYRGRLVSWTARDITGKSELRYISCEKDQEAVNHKSILFGLDMCLSYESVIIVEGPIDQMKLGAGSVALFGLGFGMDQIKLLGRFWKKIILFDPEPQAQKEARRLAGLLSAMRGEVEVALLDGAEDPGAIPQHEARHLKMELLNS